ncbi:MAG: hypothetical protein MJ025_06470 [Victivallaceae bacterium]|nr:hypothetical protein [Victivallaceae bacterium]
MKASNIAKRSISALLALSCCGCSMFAPKEETVTVTTVPADATVIANGRVGKPPFSFSARGDDTLALEVIKDGYLPHHEVVYNRFGICGMLDLVCGIFVIVPLFGLLSSAGSHTLDRHDVFISLKKDEATPAVPVVAAPAK